MSRKNLRLLPSASPPIESDEAFVKQAIADLVSAGFFFYEDEVDFIPVLRLISGEVFMLGANSMSRVK
ncbi:hypothetical protein AciX8_3727 [Granulicella mallensis MP5ACTX8]|uniref:Uncharacterized protein n=1 Tax=Granulicella mallensis (strain ATCC BAA-1857 / DSM 23137 / MP5ACTX8) TaxID=682795 RepID=G8NZI5_GRAMM|nr:hypothetical protein AciX8_3727 [Granulicella mallensis MP5ACTX8]